MASPKKMMVEVAYAIPAQQIIIAVEIDENATLENVIDRSGILLLYPEIDLAQNKIGIFSKQHKLSDVAKAGDRIEIYRQLLVDPKELRLLRAQKAGQVLRKKRGRKSRLLERRKGRASL
jgi:putative ubiquitin-RnfH superfamily antitoxin RatB of RatAB toxin-antitoxin module